MTHMMQSYSALGSWFEYLNDDCDYFTWSQYLVHRLKQAGAGACGCDVGCGNGYFTRALARAGYRMQGVDISPAMLTVATQKATEEGLPSAYFLGDITKLTLRPQVDFIVSVNDCINYVPPEKLSSTFKRLYACLNRGGVLLFDISSEYKLAQILGNNTFCEEREDIAYLWFNRFDGKAVTMDLTFFIRRKDGAFERKEERHVQYAHSEQAVLTAMAQAGFSGVAAEGHLGGEKTQRIQFIGKKL